MGEPFNSADDIGQWRYVYLLMPGGRMGSGQADLNDESDLKRYLRDPDAFAAEFFGMTKEEYCEWIMEGGKALCSERTKSGRLCRQIVAGGCIGGTYEPRQWLENHRKRPCTWHLSRSVPPGSWRRIPGIEA